MSTRVCSADFLNNSAKTKTNNTGVITQCDIIKRLLQADSPPSLVYRDYGKFIKTSSNPALLQTVTASHGGATQLGNRAVQTRTANTQQIFHEVVERHNNIKLSSFPWMHALQQS